MPAEKDHADVVVPPPLALAKPAGQERMAGYRPVLMLTERSKPIFLS